MSKIRREGSGKGWLRRAAAGLLALSLVCGLLPAVSRPVQAAEGESWAQTHLDKLVAWDVMRGDIEGNLDPDRNISRAEFVTMVNRAYGYDETGANPFTDVESTAWYSDDISIAYTVGYFTGTSATTASPDRGLTREQAALLLGRNMMLQDTPGETLGYTDSRDFSEWSRNIIRAVTEAGVINGYPDGSFRPQADITRGEVASMLTKALGTPVQEPGVHNLGSVYGNVTVTSSGVTLRNTVIAGDLYLTGGIGLGDVLLENVTVLGRIVTSGAGESNKGESSIILRNVKANEMILDSISNQFVTVRAEGDTDIASTSVRTPAYMEDMTPANLGFRYIELDGENGINLQLAGNLKEVVNLTPNSSLVVARGAAEKITVDERAAGSTLAIDMGGRVKELNLDTGTTVSGAGDVDHVNINTAGSTLAVPPDTVTVRPGITAGIAGENMDSVTAAEFSEDPRLLAGYPAARNVAPTSASAVFSTNKRGTVYWALSALADGSVNEDDVIAPPTYAGKILKSGNLQATASKTEYTANITGLTTDGSYYLTAVMVDSRGQHSPVKVTAFTTPDDTVPAFATGYPTMSKITSTSGQVTVMTTKDCLVYYALLPQGSTAPKAQDFKLGVISGSLGYGSVDAVKNSTLPFTVNNIDLEEQVTYDLYLWLTDYDGAKSSAVQKITFTTVDGTPPIVRHMDQTDAKATSVDMTYSMNEPGTLYWAVVKEGETFFRPLSGQTVPPQPADPAAKSQVESGMGALVKGSSPASRADTDIKFTISGLAGETSYDLYYVAKDAAGNYSDAVQKVTVSTLDNNAPTVKQEFTRFNGSEEENNLMPLSDTDIRLVFSESVQGVETVLGQRRYDKFIELYRAVESASDSASRAQARQALADALSKYITLYVRPAGGQPVEAAVRPASETEDNKDLYNNEWVIDYRYATVTMEDGKMVITFPNETGLNLSSGATYYFKLSGIADTAVVPNLMSAQQLPDFTTVFAQVLLEEGSTRIIESKDLTSSNDNNIDQDSNGVRIDVSFTMDPVATDKVEATMAWDALIWSDTSMTYTLYSRPVGSPIWTNEGEVTVNVSGAEEGIAYKSLARHFRMVSEGKRTPDFGPLREMVPMEYAVHINRIGDSGDYTAWNQTVTVRVSVVAGSETNLENLSNGSYISNLEAAKARGVTLVNTPDPFEIPKEFSDSVAPKFVDNYPSIRAGDIAAEIQVMLDRPGQVYYVAVPLTDIKYKTPGNTDIKNISDFMCAVLPTARDADESGMYVDGKPLPAFVPTSGTRNPTTNPPNPLYLSSPGISTITGGRFTGDVRYGSSSSLEANNAGTIRIDSLIPDTMYYVYLVTKGVSAIYSEYAMCYYFKTEDAVRPVITMDISNPNVRVTVDRDSTLDYILVMTGREDSQFHEDFIGYAKDPDNLPAAYQDLSVLDAMSTDVIQGRASVGTAFDLYATEAAKNKFASLIRNQSVSGTDVVMKGTDRFSASEAYKLVECTGMEGTNYYTFLAVGRSDMGSGDAFRSIRPVFKRDDQWPMITAATAYGRYNATDDKIESGVITLNFDDALYFRTQGTTTQETKPVDDCDSHTKAQANKSTSIKDLVTSLAAAGITVETDASNSGHGQAIQAITLNIKDAMVGASISFDANICDRSGNIHNTQLVVILTITPQMNTTTGKIEYVLGCNITPEWDGRENK